MKSSHTLRLSLLASAATAAIAALAPPARAATYDWNSGSFVQGVTAPDPLALGDTLVIAGGGNKFLDGATLNVQGTVNWTTTDTIYMMNGGSVNNAGLWQSFAANTLANNGGSTPSFTNSGSFSKLGDAGATTVGAIAFVNSGVINAETGNILFTGGNTVFNAGTSFVGAAGQTVIASNASFNGAFASSNLLLAAGTFSGTAAVLGGAVPGSVAYTGGTLAGGWRIAANQTLAVAGGGNKFLDGLALDNQGQLNWNSTDTAYLMNGTQVDNHGSFNVGQSMTLANNGGTPPSFNNEGSLNVAAGQTLSVGGIAFVNRSGGVIAAAGTVDFNGGNAVFQDNTVFSGGGPVNINSNASFAGTWHGSTVAVNAGVASGIAAVVDGSLKFSGGTLRGGWTVSPGSQLVVTGGGNKFLDGLALDNAGTMHWNTTDTAYLMNGTVLNNSGRFDVNQSMNLANNGGTLPVFNNFGTLAVAAGQTLTVGSLAFVNHSGGVIDTQGTVNFSGGNALFQDHTVFAGPGAVNVYSNASFAGGYSGANVVLNAGTASGSAAVLHGTTRFNGGSMSGTWAVAGGGGNALVLASGGNKFADGLQLANAGTLAVQTSDTLYLQNGSQITNTGTIDFRADGNWVSNGGAASGIVNQGLMLKSGGSGSSAIANGLGLSNLGVIDVRSGSIALPANFGNAGTMQGTGAYTVAGTLSNAGHLAPGALGVAAGELVLNGNYAQASTGSFDVGLDLAQASRLLVNGAVALDGTIDVACLGSCNYAVGTRFEVITSSGAVSGSFSGGLQMTGFAQGAFAVDYSQPNQVWLRVTSATVSAVPEPSSGALLFAGLAAVGFMLRRQRS